MQHSNDDNALLVCMVEQPIRESMKWDAPKGAVNDLKPERVFLCKRDRATYLREKVIRERRRDLPVPQSRLANILLGESPNDYSFDHSDRRAFSTSSHDSPSSGFC